MAQDNGKEEWFADGNGEWYILAVYRMRPDMMHHKDDDPIAICPIPLRSHPDVISTKFADAASQLSDFFSSRLMGASHE